MDVIPSAPASTQVDHRHGHTAPLVGDSVHGPRATTTPDRNSAVGRTGPCRSRRVAGEGLYSPRIRCTVEQYTHTEYIAKVTS